MSSAPSPESPSENLTESQGPFPWLVRISETFESMASEVLDALGAVSRSRLGIEYYFIKTMVPEAVTDSEAAKFVRWNVPVEHSWPCNPQRMTGFIEKAAQAMFKKFGKRNPQAILISPINPSAADRYYKDMASNLRGRTLQLFPPMRAKEVEDQNVNEETLFCLVGREGLFCGMQTPRKSNGLHAGGSRYISLSLPGTISRAGGKIAEALHYLLLYKPRFPEGMHWLELGACPGGMTSELLARGHEVTAIDRAALDRRLDGHPGLKFIQADVAEFQAPSGVRYDAILSDMNGPPHEAMQQVIRLAPALKRGGLVVFTLKFSRVDRLQDPNTLFRAINNMAEGAGLHLFAKTHLTYNGHEFTMFFESKK